jgi:hypothetical protein
VDKTDEEAWRMLVDAMIRIGESGRHEADMIELVAETGLPPEQIDRVMKTIPGVEEIEDGA